MTATSLSLEVGRRSLPGREELRRQLLALVLAFVLVWYTFVVPAGAGSFARRGVAPEDDGQDGEVRGTGAAPPAAGVGARPSEDLDWPEYIYPE
jgi:hypothetical protein